MMIWCTSWWWESPTLHFYRLKGSLTCWMVWEELVLDDAISYTQWGNGLQTVTAFMPCHQFDLWSSQTNVLQYWCLSLPSLVLRVNRKWQVRTHPDMLPERCQNAKLQKQIVRLYRLGCYQHLGCSAYSRTEPHFPVTLYAGALTTSLFGGSLIQSTYNYGYLLLLSCEGTRLPSSPWNQKPFNIFLLPIQIMYLCAI